MLSDIQCYCPESFNDAGRYRDRVYLGVVNLRFITTAQGETPFWCLLGVPMTQFVRDCDSGTSRFIKKKQKQTKQRGTVSSDISRFASKLTGTFSDSAQFNILTRCSRACISCQVALTLFPCLTVPRFLTGNLYNGRSFEAYDRDSSHGEFSLKASFQGQFHSVWSRFISR